MRSNNWDDSQDDLKTFSLVNKINVLTFSQKMFILEFNSEMEIIKEAGSYIALTAFTLDQ